MDSKITTDTGLRVQIDQSRVRQAPKTDFGSMVSTGLSRTANAVMDAGAIAAPFIPGGAVLSAAISGVGTLKASASGMTAGATGANSNTLNFQGGVSGAGGAGGMGGAGGAGAPGGVPGDMNNPLVAGRAMMAEQMSLNMQYLMLQNQMQQENRQFTTLSNVMKTKHDTAKNAINNVR